MKNRYSFFQWTFTLLLGMMTMTASAQFCDQAQGTAGFPSDPACETSVCAQDSWCCDTSWDGICAGIAASDAACSGCLAPNCDEAQGTAGFPSDPACETSVCAQDSWCCTNTWDGICAGIAASDPACEGCVSPVAATPANNDCADAISVDVSGFCLAVQGTTDGATGSGVAACTGTANNDVWYSFVAPEGGEVTVGVGGSASFDAVLEVFSGTCGSLTSIACADATFDGGIEVANLTGLTPGATYYYRVYHWFTAMPATPEIATCVTEPCDFAVPEGAMAEAEACGTDGNGGCNMDTPTFGSISVNETVSGTIWADAGSRDTDWYEFTLTEAAEVTLMGSAQFPFVLLIAEIDGSCNADVLNSVLGEACEPASVTQALDAGTYIAFVSSQLYDDMPCGSGANEYYMTLGVTDCNGEVGGTAFIDDCNVCVGGSTGLTACPNLCADAIDVSCGDVVTGTTVGATNAGAPGTCTTSLNTAPGVWYRFEGNGDNVTASLCGSSFDTKIGVFSGACGSLVCVIGNDDACSLQSEVTFPSTVGVDYYIYVTGFGTAVGNYTLSLTCVTPPPPLCESATPISCGDVVSGSTVGAVNDPTAGTCVTTLTTAPGVYYVIEGTGLDITASLCGSSFDTKIGVFSGDCGSLVCVTGNDDMGAACEVSGLHSEVTFTSVAGESYYIYVTGFSTAAGDYLLSIECDFLDCNGDLNGTAFLDDCNECVGGNTGLDACVEDCNGDFGGTAFLDDCNECVGGNTGLDACVEDCNGDLGGTAFLDGCNECVGGNTGLDACVEDCNGDFGGTAFLDDCNECVGGNTGLDACVEDCNGDFGGTAEIDECGDCAGGNTGIEPCVPIGVADAGLDQGLSVYPNPNNGQFIVELNGAEGVGTLNIMDMMGRRVYTQGVNLNGSFRQSFDLNVANGTYILQVVTENGIATRKVQLH